MFSVKPPVVASSLALLAALAAFPTPCDARDARARAREQDSPPFSSSGPDDLIYVMPPLRPLTGAAAPSKKPAKAETASKQVAPVASTPAPTEQSAPQASPKVAETTEPRDKTPAAPTPEAPASGPVAADLPALAVHAPMDIMAQTAPTRVLDWQGAGLQSGLPPSFALRLEPAGETNAAGDPAGQEPASQEQPVVEAPAVTEASGETQAAAPVSALLAEGLVGPTEVRLADRATMWLPAGYIFIPLEAARKLAGEVGLAWRAGALGLVAPAGGAVDWLAPIELLDDGHIRAEDAGALDPEKVLAAFRASLPAVNAQRAATGQGAVALEGWLASPALDAKHRLSACVMVSTADANAPDRFFTCEAWSLGRAGALKIGLVEGAEKSERLKGEIKALAGTIVFDRGKTYEDFDPAADRVAPYQAADLLVHDVSAKIVPPSGAGAKGDAPAASLLEQLSSVAYPAFFGGAALLLLLRVKRRRAKEGPSDPPAPEPTPRARSTPGRVSAPVSAPAASAETARAPGAFAALISKIPMLGAFGKRMRAGVAAEVAQTAPANDAEEPIAALRTFAARMRGAREPSSSIVDEARILRRRRVTGGGAPAFVENLDADALILEAEAERAEPAPSVVLAAEPAVSRLGAAGADPLSLLSGAPPAAPAVEQNDDLGLIEPGDSAASAAISVARARREA